MIPYARNVALVRAKLAQLRPTQFSVGYAEGFEPGGRQRSEVMASLKILGSQTPQ